MILQALASYYEVLTDRQILERPGWSNSKMSWAAEIDECGRLINLIPLKTESADGKKMLPRALNLPSPVKKSSGERSNFLWENAEYIFCFPKMPNPDPKTEKRFKTAKELHLKILQDVHTPESIALKSFFETWNINDQISRFSEDEAKSFEKGEYVTFFYKDRFISEYDSIKTAWQKAYDEAADGEMMIDLISGEKVVPEATHPLIKGVMNAQMAGAALVSFNGKAYESYGHEKNINSPIGKYNSFAYTSALNHLISDKDHRQHIGDMTVVYWVRDGDSDYQSVMDSLLKGSDGGISDEALSSIMRNAAVGNRIFFNEKELLPDNEFYILGLSPNAARISVRFFCQNTFGTIVTNIKKHYDDIYIIKDNRSKWETIPLWALLRETALSASSAKSSSLQSPSIDLEVKENVKSVSSTKSPSPQMSGDVLKAILFGGRYPETLMYQTIMRIRAEHDVTRGRAAIIKGYLLRNTENLLIYNKIKEVATVALNEESNYTPYVLGRLFSVLEATQQAANPGGINSTIKDRYFNSACSTPASVFPLLLKLANSHLKKLATGSQVYYNKSISDLIGKIGMTFPQTLSLQEQGTFILGYYHQTQKRFEKKNNDTEEN